MNTLVLLLVLFGYEPQRQQEWTHVFVAREFRQAEHIEDNWDHIQYIQVDDNNRSELRIYFYRNNIAITFICLNFISSPSSYNYPYYFTISNNVISYLDRDCFGDIVTNKGKYIGYFCSPILRVHISKTPIQYLYFRVPEEGPLDKMLGRTTYMQWPNTNGSMNRPTVVLDDYDMASIICKKRFIP